MQCAFLCPCGFYLLKCLPICPSQKPFQYYEESLILKLGNLKFRQIYLYCFVILSQRQQIHHWLFLGEAETESQSQQVCQVLYWELPGGLEG